MSANEKIRKNMAGETLYLAALRTPDRNFCSADGTVIEGAAAPTILQVLAEY